MANLEELASEIRNDGYSEVNAEARVCQDIVLKAIANRKPESKCHGKGRRCDAKHYR
ncbi:MAG: hypothetical protein IJ188_06690 [Clostridia bacterium]|nr:hypothetical protein [Clostridia bacterium]